MRQLFQDAREATIQVVDIPEPALKPRSLLVRNGCSVISPGTERAVVATARQSYLTTARARPDLVRRVLDIVKREGVLEAYRRVQAKRDEPQPLGYSSAGTVVEVGPGAGDYFRVGDRVACCGMGVASHAETICVPVNLAAKIPDGVDLESAAFATLGAIALHGVRQSTPTLGERFAVVGLGILGLITVQILRAAGVRVAAFDLAPDLVERARGLGAEVGVAGSTDDQVATALAWSDGLGVDGVLVTATSTSDAPLKAAAGMCRDRARVVAVGQVPFGLPREMAYAKELDLRISRSYGPGRYDPAFEEQGRDYPPGYVRWTETRNLEAFLHLLADGRMDLATLITHRYDLDDAPAAYDLLHSGRGERPLGMVIRYAAPEAGTEPPAPPARVHEPAPGTVGVGFVGAGGFARSTLLPAFRNVDGVSLRRVVTAHGLTAHDARKKFGFGEIGTDLGEALADPGVQLVCIVTRHDLHAAQVCASLRAGKHVFVEKPLAITEEQLDEVEETAKGSPGLLLVGFNRRFSPMAVAVREALSGRAPLLMTYRVNAGVVPKEHWVNDPEVGGGRIVGEACHFIDLLSFLTGDAGITTVQTVVADRHRGAAENAGIQIGFADGSVGQILYTAKASPALGKERVEAHAGGASAVIEDYRRCTITTGRRSRRVTQGGKGHGEEIRALIRAVRAGGPSPIPLPVLLEVSRATLAVQAARSPES